METSATRTPPGWRRAAGLIKPEEKHLAPDLIELLDCVREVAHAGDGVLVVSLVGRGADLLEGVKVHRRVEVAVDRMEKAKSQGVLIC